LEAAQQGDRHDNQVGAWANDQAGFDAKAYNSSTSSTSTSSRADSYAANVKTSSYNPKVVLAAIFALLLVIIIVETSLIATDEDPVPTPAPIPPPNHDGLISYEYTIDRDFPGVPGKAGGIAISRSEIFMVVNDTINVYEVNSGAWQRSFSTATSGNPTNPKGIFYRLETDSLWIADEGGQDPNGASGVFVGCGIKEFSTGGIFQRSIGGSDCSGSTTPTLNFNRPTQAIADTFGELFVSEGQGATMRVSAWDLNNNNANLWATGAAGFVAGTGKGEFNIPYDLALDFAYNRLYVADRLNNRVQILDAK